MTRYILCVISILLGNITYSMEVAADKERQVYQQEQEQWLQQIFMNLLHWKAAKKKRDHAAQVHEHCININTSQRGVMLAPFNPQVIEIDSDSEQSEQDEDELEMQRTLNYWNSKVADFTRNTITYLNRELKKLIDQEIDIVPLVWKILKATQPYDDIKQLAPIKGLFIFLANQGIHILTLRYNILMKKFRKKKEKNLSGYVIIGQKKLII